MSCGLSWFVLRHWVVRGLCSFTTIGSGSLADPHDAWGTVLRQSDFPRWAVGLGRSIGFPFPLGRLESMAGNGDLKDHTVIHRPVDGSRRRYRIREDLLPFRERKIAPQAPPTTRLAGGAGERLMTRHPRMTLVDSASHGIVTFSSRFRRTTSPCAESVARGAGIGPPPRSKYNGNAA